MSKHTPEPWFVKHLYNVMDSADRGCVAACGGRANNMDGGKVERENRANALRIVDCVNTLAGWEDLSKVKALLDAIQQHSKSTGSTPRLRAWAEAVNLVGHLSDSLTEVQGKEPKDGR